MRPSASMLTSRLPSLTSVGRRAGHLDLAGQVLRLGGEHPAECLGVVGADDRSTAGSRQRPQQLLVALRLVQSHHVHLDVGLLHRAGDARQLRGRGVAAVRQDDDVALSGATCAGHGLRQSVVEAGAPRQLQVLDDRGRGGPVEGRLLRDADVVGEGDDADVEVGRGGVDEQLGGPLGLVELPVGGHAPAGVHGEHRGTSDRVGRVGGQRSRGVDRLVVQGDLHRAEVGAGVAGAGDRVQQAELAAAAVDVVDAPAVRERRCGHGRQADGHQQRREAELVPAPAVPTGRHGLRPRPWRRASGRRARSRARASR